MTLAACAPIASGPGFLKSTLAYLDCAGEAVGSAGYAALGGQGSPIQALLLAGVTLFIAWQGVRMMFGRSPDMHEAVMSVAKIGLVIMLVASWPAVRTIAAGPVQKGPAELALQAGLGGPRQLEERLQRADDGVVALTSWGTGKLDIRVGRTAGGQPAASAFSGIALTDNLALGLGRLAYLVTALATLGLIKLLAGAMIASLPLFAGLILFDATRGVFLGWARLMFALLAAGLVVPMLLTVELSLLEPWLAKVISERSATLATPSAPTELLAMTGSFLLIIMAATALLVRACLSVSPTILLARIAALTGSSAAGYDRSFASNTATVDRRGHFSRAERLAQTISRLESRPVVPALAGPASVGGASHRQSGFDRKPATRQRARQRSSLSNSKRDQA